MSNQYAHQTPVDKAGGMKNGYPPSRVALATSNKENASASSILLLTHDTTEIEVAIVTSSVAGAEAGGVAGKWLSQATVDSSVAGTSVITAAGTANFDFVVVVGVPRRFVVPIATIQQSTSLMGVNRANGLYPAVAFKTFAGSGSVLTMEF